MLTRVGGSSATTLPFSKAASDALLDSGAMKGLDQIQADGGAYAYIRRELKIDRENLQNDSMIRSLTDPTQWLEDRKEALNGIAAEIATLYQNELIHYYNNGYTADESIQKATQVANINYQIKKQELEAQFPGSTSYGIGNKNYEKKYRKLKSRAVNGKASSQSIGKKTEEQG